MKKESKPKTKVTNNKKIILKKDKIKNKKTTSNIKKSNLKFPIVIINFKTYESSVGDNSLKLAKACEAAAKITRKNVAICVSATNIFRISKAIDIPVFSEHIDPEDFGAHTGKVLIKDIKDNGAEGSLINHSEDRYRLDLLEESVKKMRENNLISIVCANNDESAEAIATFEPDVIAVEPPELIGGDISVTDANPSIIKNTIKKVRKIDKNLPILCGAGIKTGNDVKKSIELGCAGVLVASVITKAKNPKKTLIGLLEGL